METLKNSCDHHPSNFEKYLPWACHKLGVFVSPNITRVEQYAHAHSSGTASLRTISKSGTSRATRAPLQTKKQSVSKDSTRTLTGSTLQVLKNQAAIPVDMYAIYNNSNQLTQIKFCKNTFIPKDLLKVIITCIPYHKHLTTVYINGGLKQDGMVVLNKIVAMSNITDVTLDNTAGLFNCYILLGENSALKNLSLARCKVGDDTVREIASRLSDPLQASNTLAVLNLSSNGITDVGAKYLGEALRVNRQLAYLNLAGNMITDTGADSIFNSLIEFPLTADELQNVRLNHFIYLRQRIYLKMKHIQMLRESGIDPRTAKIKTGKLTSKPNEKTYQINDDATKEAIWLDMAESHVKNLLGPFRDPFQADNLVTEDKVSYCFGNNALCYLNLAYNNLSYISVKKLCNVLCSQRNLKREPKGLINVCIEGNNIPKSCEELDEISNIIEAGFPGIKKKIVIKANTAK